MPNAGSFRRLVSRILIGTTAILTPLSGAHASAPTGQIMIGEVAWAGSSASTADEWVELWNTGSSDISLAGYSLHGGSDKPIFLPATAIIPAKGAYLIANYPDTDTKSALGVPVQSVTTTISLSNSTLELSLRNETNIEVDRAGNGGLPPAGFSSTTKATMVRAGDSWIDATASIGFDPARTDLGTPGTCDGCSAEPLPVEPTPIPTPDPEPTPVVPTSTEQVPEPTPEPTPPIVEETSTTTLQEPIEEPVVTPTPAEPVVDQPVEPPIVQATSTTAEEPAPEPVETVEETSLPEEHPVEPTPEPQSTSPSTEQASPSSSSPSVTETIHYENLRVNEVMTNPEDGSEWVEVTSIHLASPIPLEDVTLHDATGKIATIATGTIDATTPFIRITLSSARLNNDGDTVSIHAPTGEVMDGLAYTYSEKGHSWIRIPDAIGAWHVTLNPTPEEANVLTEEPTTLSTGPETVTTTSTVQAPVSTPVTNTTSVATVTPLVSAPIQTTPTKPAATTPTASSTTKKTAPKPATPSTPKAKTAPKTAAPKASTAKKTTTTAKKPAATKKASVPTLITHAMTNLEANAGVPVALIGTVGTPPGLLSGHYFILLSEDGRGLRVHVPTSRKLPNAGETVRVVGVLSFSDEGVPSLGMRKDDPLETTTGLRKPEPRLVDLMTPSTEDAWSLIQVTGNVTAVKGQTVSIDLGDADIDMVVKSSIGYRVSRLKVGDTLRVRGLIQLGDLAPTLLPRHADDIEIVGHVNIVPATTQTPSLPGWTPFAAAGVAVAGTEGLKRLRERYSRLKLEKRLRSGLNTPEPSIV